MGFSVSNDVTSAASGLDEAPPIEERQVMSVDLEHVVHHLVEVTQRECQHCGDIVDLTEPHPHAVLWVEDSINRIMYKPDFCDRECWLEWMRTAESS